jgi:hypothetical protein
MEALSADCAAIACRVIDAAEEGKSVDVAIAKRLGRESVQSSVYA